MSEQYKEAQSAKNVATNKTYTGAVAGKPVTAEEYREKIMCDIKILSNSIGYLAHEVGVIIDWYKMPDSESLTSFGNYLLSEERNSSVSELNKGNVTHADIENWKAKQG